MFCSIKNKNHEHTLFGNYFSIILKLMIDKCEAQLFLSKFIEDSNSQEIQDYMKRINSPSEEEMHKMTRVYQISQILKISSVSLETAKNLISKAYSEYGSHCFSLIQDLNITDGNLTDLLDLFSLMGNSFISTKIQETNSLIKDLRQEVNDLYYDLDKNSEYFLQKEKKPVCFQSDIFQAASDGDIVSISYILKENKENINAKDEKGQTPLILASWKGQNKVVDYLLSHGADVNAKTAIGSTALMYASESNAVGIMKMLKDKGADVNQKNSTGSTPLSYAALRNSVNAAQFLIDNGANVNEPDNNGSTPLFCATFKNSIDVAKILVKNGADLSFKNIQGRVAKDYCTTMEMAQFYYELEQ